MKPKPTPKRELVIIYATAYPQGGGLVFLRCVSEDAKNWIRENVSAFGVLSDNDPRNWMLSVYAEYNAQEIAEWLDSYNDEEEA